MCQQRRAIHIANGVNRITGRPQLFINFDVAASQFDSQRFEANPSTEWRTTDRNKNLIRSPIFQAVTTFESNFEATGKFFYAMKLGAGENLDTFFLKYPLQLARH